MRSLNKFLKIQRLLVAIRRAYFVKVWGMEIDPTSVISLSAKLDLTYPKGIHIGSHTYIAFGAAILSHDMTRALKTDTRIGSHCFIGARSIILPGVTIGDHSIVAAGAIVTKSVPPNCIVAGNPATIMREGIHTETFGRLVRTAPAEAGSGAAAALD
jgi:acetyltransferase-like isoleucine patch superfamily enzyme